jgi:hypothetical protein
MNKQTGSVLAILVGVGILFAAATNRVGAAISALRGSSSAEPVADKTDVQPNDNPGDDTGDSATVGKSGVTNTLMRNGTHRYEQTGRVR